MVKKSGGFGTAFSVAQDFVNFGEFTAGRVNNEESRSWSRDFCCHVTVIIEVWLLVINIADAKLFESFI